MGDNDNGGGGSAGVVAVLVIFCDRGGRGVFCLQRRAFWWEEEPS